MVSRKMGASRHVAEDPCIQLHEHFRGPLMAFFLRRVKQRVEAEDLTQETLLRAIGAQSLDHVSHAESYIFKIAANVLNDRGRYRQSRQADRHDPYEETSHAIEDFSPERVLMGKQSIGKVARCLHEMPERARVAFVLHRFEGLRHPEIARRLGVSVSAVEKYIMATLLHIKSRMSE